MDLMLTTNAGIIEVGQVSDHEKLETDSINHYPIQAFLNICSNADQESEVHEGSTFIYRKNRAKNQMHQLRTSNLSPDDICVLNNMEMEQTLSSRKRIFSENCVRESKQKWTKNRHYHALFKIKSNAKRNYVCSRTGENKIALRNHLLFMTKTNLWGNAIRSTYSVE